MDASRKVQGSIHVCSLNFKFQCVQDSGDISLCSRCFLRLSKNHLRGQILGSFFLFEEHFNEL